MEFESFGKIRRMHAECIITEKIDGTNAQIAVCGWTPGDIGQRILAGSRNRWVKPGDDNYGFAAWVESHSESLSQLLPGRYFGEWWGKGIQRGYGLEEKRFTSFKPFDVMAGETLEVTEPLSEISMAPLFHRLPILYEGMYHPDRVYEALDLLKSGGSRAAPMFMRAEGVVVYFPGTRDSFKVTFDGLEYFDKPEPWMTTHWDVVGKDYRKGDAREV